mmetsp:Transcript_45968/g.85572  ORF Transcript_45968/g.85572 Transcript_45968/m.85572 type:complete len:243 (+) Transcript_45968:387-1115(+)
MVNIVRPYPGDPTQDPEPEPGPSENEGGRLATEGNDGPPTAPPPPSSRHPADTAQPTPLLDKDLILALDGRDLTEGTVEEFVSLLRLGGPSFQFTVLRRRLKPHLQDDMSGPGGASAEDSLSYSEVPRTSAEGSSSSSSSSPRRRVCPASRDAHRTWQALPSVRVPAPTHVRLVVPRARRRPRLVRSRSFVGAGGGPVLVPERDRHDVSRQLNSELTVLLLLGVVISGNAAASFFSVSPKRG